MLSPEIIPEIFGFVIGAFALTGLVGLAGRAFFSDFECSRKYGKSRIGRLWNAFATVFGLMLLPFLVVDLFKNAPAAAAGIRLSAALMVIAAAFGGSFLLTALIARRGWKLEPSETVTDETISKLPVAKHTNWPLMAVILLATASGIGAYAGSGGTLAGYALAFALNPLLGMAYFYFEMIGAQRCPHCRRLIGNHCRDNPVGSPIWCGFCCNYSRKG
jgi:hypothetical protein